MRSQVEWSEITVTVCELRLRRPSSASHDQHHSPGQRNRPSLVLSPSVTRANSANRRKPYLSCTSTKPPVTLTRTVRRATLFYNDTTDSQTGIPHYDTEQLRMNAALYLSVCTTENGTTVIGTDYYSYYHFCGDIVVDVVAVMCYRRLARRTSISINSIHGHRTIDHTVSRGMWRE